jgi:CRP/FNR family cyclic AMP-dependent transcriptional regulator
MMFLAVFYARSKNSCEKFLPATHTQPQMLLQFTQLWRRLSVTQPVTGSAYIAKGCCSMRFLEMFRGWDDVEDFSAQSVIFREREPADFMYVVLSGEVELTLHGESLGVEGEGGIIGEMAMINSATRSATATTLTKVKLARLDRDQFRALVGENADFSLHVMAVLANRLRAVNNYITTQFAQFR